MIYTDMVKVVCMDDSGELANGSRLRRGEFYEASEYNDRCYLVNGYVCRKARFTVVSEDTETAEIPQDIPTPAQTGQKWDSGKTNPDLLYDDVPLALELCIRVLDYGQAKYNADGKLKQGGWKLVDRLIERYKKASSRHDLAIRKGELKDDESGLAHRAHKIINELFVLQTELEQGVYGPDALTFKDPHVK